MSRILIAGGPRTGKTTFARQLGTKLGVVPLHTDNLIATHSWSEASAAVAEWLSTPGPWLVEGVAVARAIRKWLAANERGAPADVIYLGHHPLEVLTAGQVAMTKGCAKVWNEIEAEVRARGVQIHTL